jgi:hypothetical protein
MRRQRAFRKIPPIDRFDLWSKDERVWKDRLSLIEGKLFRLRPLPLAFVLAPVRMIISILADAP